MADPIVPPAGTPPANNPVPGGQPPAEPLKEPEKKTLTQAEIDAIVEDRLKRDREGREEKLGKELGMSLKDAKVLIAARKAAEEKEKTELEKAHEKAAEFEKALKDRDLRDLKRAKVEAMIAEKKIKLPDGVSISDVLEMVSGQDEDGIIKSVEKLPKFFPFNATLGSGTNPANGGGKAPTIDEQIKAAQEHGLKTGDWNGYNQLTLQKQAKG
ncbi:DUF4355 domain-containing protein [Candidatus Pacearchaeota archaeon]|jgi:DNA-binding transcriptional MerR regulator|nr:DUF4355 domain-containing protein [Candidatus Pacearchaeota archaeon]